MKRLPIQFGKSAVDSGLQTLGAIKGYLSDSSTLGMLIVKILMQQLMIS